MAALADTSFAMLAGHLAVVSWVTALTPVPLPYTALHVLAAFLLVATLAWASAFAAREVLAHIAAAASRLGDALVNLYLNRL